MSSGITVARIELPYLLSDYDRHGNKRWFVRLPAEPGRKSRRKIRIKAAPGTEAFTTAYWEARNGTVASSPRIVPPSPGTFRAIAQHYLASRDFKSLDRRLTQRPRQLLLGKLIDLIGEKPAIIDPKVIRDGVRRRGYGAAKEFLTALRAVYRVALEDGLVTTDPTVGIRAPRPKVEGWHSWTWEDCAAYEKRWPIGTKQRTTYAIGLYTAQRISDAVVLGRQHIRQGRLEFTQRKNQKHSPVRVVIPIAPPLAEALAGWQGTGLTFLETAYGRPYSADGLSNCFREWCDAAGLQHCTFHGLRKAAATRLAEAGCTPHQIMAVLGHQTHQQAALYTRAADRAGMADQALGRLYGERMDPLGPTG
jgi:integrase